MRADNSAHAKTRKQYRADENAPTNARRQMRSDNFANATTAVYVL